MITAAKKLPEYPIVVRLDKKTDHVYLCMLDGYPGEYPELTVYDGEHTGGSRAWYLNNTKPCHDSELELKLFMKYINEPYPWEGESVPVLRKRLPWFKRLPKVSQ